MCTSDDTGKCLAIVGSRDYQNYVQLSKEVDEFIKLIENKYNTKIKTIASGGAKGCDQLAEQYAKERKLECLVFHAKWSKYGRSAGPRRNSRIVNNSDYMMAFPSSKSIGTYDSINKARKKKIEIKIIHV
jgi:hypothetical protein